MCQAFNRFRILAWIGCDTNTSYEATEKVGGSYTYVLSGYIIFIASYLTTVCRHQYTSCAPTAIRYSSRIICSEKTQNARCFFWIQSLITKPDRLDKVKYDQQSINWDNEQLVNIKTSKLEELV